MKESKIFFSCNLITNFKPYNLNLIKKANFKLKKCNKQVYCKNFFLYLLILKYNKNIFLNSEIHIKKFKKKVYTFLKAPYRYKIARHQISLNRYFLNFSTKISLKNNIYLNSWGQLIKLFKFLKNFEKQFESNLIYVNSLKFNAPIFYKNNFFLKNYKKKAKNK